MDWLFDHRLSSVQKILFGFLAISIVVSIVAAMVSNSLVLIGLPVVIMIVYIGLVDFRKLYYLLYLTVPISIAIDVGGGFSTDLPSEPLMIGLSFVAVLHLLSNKVEGFSDFVKHPLTILLILHIGWTLLCALNSDYRLIGFKFLLAKIWYLIPFYFLTGMLCKSQIDIHRLFRWALIPMGTIIVITLVRHWMTDFSFSSVNFIMGPWFINHVMYAATIVAVFPFLIVLLFFTGIKGKNTFPMLRWVLKLGLIGLFILAVALSYTRAAMLSLIIAGMTYFVIRWRLMIPSLILSFLILIFGVSYLSQDNRYLAYAPEYTKAISHERFGNLVQATSQLEDVSTMERVFRWVAGARMIKEKPLLGFGPGSFYSSYKPYTVTGFKTYVSHNFDKSGIHCYFLMVFVEQGIIGGLIFLIFSIMLLVYGERIYHCTINKGDRAIILATTLGLVIINALILINDLLETDKIGAFYFTYAAILVIMDLKQKRMTKKSNTSRL